MCKILKRLIVKAYHSQTLIFLIKISILITTALIQFFSENTQVFYLENKRITFPFKNRFLQDKELIYNNNLLLTNNENPNIFFHFKSVYIELIKNYFLAHYKWAERVDKNT